MVTAARVAPVMRLSAFLQTDLRLMLVMMAPHDRHE